MQRTPIVSLTLSSLLAAAAAAGPTPTPTGDFTRPVAMHERSASTFYVSGEIAGAGPVEFLVDTGSGYTVINEQTLDALAQAGSARYVKQLRGVLADGRTREVPVYAIAHLRVGDCWLTDVEVAVFPGKSRQILGLSALRKAAPFTFAVDPPSLSLSHCGEPVAPAEQAAGPAPSLD